MVEKKMGQLEAELKGRHDFEEEQPFSFSGFESETTKEVYIKMVETAKEHILAGDIFQVVPSRRMKS
ncbi:anthranilate synthase component I, partial [Alkalibacillus haloalkaliphilus]|nr:anthranilate synthase component I [Alkalibacillus haloalkaliphilus]